MKTNKENRLESWKDWQDITWEIVGTKKKKGTNGYFPFTRKYYGLPYITACPRINLEKFRLMFRKSKFDSNIMTLAIKKAPKQAFVSRLINFNFKKDGAPQICLRGNMGTYKSNLLNLLAGFYAIKGIRMIYFVDDAFEVRNLCGHGYQDKKGDFYPFQFDVWIPKGYKFKEKSTTNEIWKYRSNVRKCEYTSIDQILNTLEDGKFTVIYESCFTKESKLKLLNDIYLYCAENVSLDTNYMLVHHELQTLIKENPTTDVYEITNQIKDRFARSRKDKVGILASWHKSSEVYHSISDKFRFIGEKKPTNKKILTKVEKDAQKQRRDCVNMSIDGYWATHWFSYWPELPDIYRLVPQREKLTYPELEVEKKKSKKKSTGVSPIQARRYIRYLAGQTYQEQADKEGVSRQAIMDSIRKAEKKIGVI